MPIASRCAESPCEKTATHPGIQARNDPYLLHRGSRGKGAAAPFPCTPNPRRVFPPLCSGRSHLTMPNTACTIISPASLRSDCCSSSLRNAVHLLSGIDVRLHRNTQMYGEGVARGVATLVRCEQGILNPIGRCGQRKPANNSVQRNCSQINAL
jgi:hypothetical protein